MNSNIYPRSNDFQTIYLNMVIKNPAIIVGDYTIYNDFVNDPVLFEKNHRRSQNDEDQFQQPCRFHPHKDFLQWNDAF